MTLNEIIEKRRAYRSLSPVTITPELIHDLAKAAGLAPSCFNNQPWQYVFVYDPEQLTRMHAALNPGNEWAKSASLIIAVLGKKESDCVMKDGREYFLFDIGMASAFLILQATVKELVAHPIAGYDPVKVKEVLQIPEGLNVITLIIAGKHSDKINPVLSEKQIESEKERPVRLELNKFVHYNSY